MNKHTKKYKLKTNKFRKTKRVSIGGMKTYELDGALTTDSTKLYKGQDFFRKMTKNKNEIKLCKLIQKNPHKNIVEIYNVGRNYIDMELLNTDIPAKDMSDVKDTMNEVKSYLQNLGVMYIDWKLDNVGISVKDGYYKLFDFDVSGLINIKTQKWKIKPPIYAAYRKAIVNGAQTPAEIDDSAFASGFQEYTIV